MSDIRRRAERWSRWFGVATWAVLVLTLPACTFLPAPLGGGAESWAGQTMLPTYFVLLLAQVSCAVVAGRRSARSALLLALCLWGLGSLAYSAAAANHLEATATPGVGYYVAAYMLLAVYLLADLPRKGNPSPVIWIDALIVAGGAACLAGASLMVFSRYDAGHHPDRLVGLLYPALDILLATVVLIQVRLRIRPPSPMTWALIGGLSLLTVADVILAQGVFDRNYHRYPGVDVVCGIGLSLIVWAACRARLPRADRSGRRHEDRMPTMLSLSASAVALVVVALSATHHGTAYLMTPALVTLLAGQVRMWLAVREARGAAEARALSLTDDLTGLPNRRALTTRLEDLLAAPGRLSLVLLDLDGFKEINDGLGHQAGDALLRQVAHRVGALVPEDALLARLGGDEFAIALSVDGEDELVAFTAAVLADLARPHVVDGVQLAVSGSVGIAVRPEAPADFDATELLRRADVAMYQAKESRCGTLVYDPDRDEFSRDRLELVDDLRQAIDRGEIEMWYQPQVDASSGAVCGLEALVRWRHPERGLVSPAVFLPAARRAGLMARLSEEIVRQVVTDVVGWGRDRDVPRVAINVAPPELLGNALIPFLLGELAVGGLPRESVVLEVTEDSFVSDPERARDLLELLAREGIGVSIDDYGTGFSSLAYLRDLPVEELKIDRSFIAAVHEDQRSRMIVSSTATLAHALSMRVVAEGVETAEVARTLVALGIDVLQGYHLCRPLPAAELPRWLDAPPTRLVPSSGRAVPVPAAASDGDRRPAVR